MSTVTKDFLIGFILLLDELFEIMYDVAGSN